MLAAILIYSLFPLLSSPLHSQFGYWFRPMCDKHVFGLQAEADPECAPV